MPSTWTPEREELLRKLVGEGHSSSVISGQLGLGRGAIIGKCDRLGLRLKGSKDPTRQCRARKPKPKPKPFNFGASSLKHQKRAPETATPPVPAPALDLSCRVSLFETGNTRCKWPLWNDGDTHRDCCGAQVEGLGPYCAHHTVRACNPVQVRRREAKFS